MTKSQGPGRGRARRGQAERSRRGSGEPEGAGLARAEVTPPGWRCAPALRTVTDGSAGAGWEEGTLVVASAGSAGAEATGHGEGKRG